MILLLILSIFSFSFSNVRPPYHKRQSSKPLLSGDTFLKLADHVLESINYFDYLDKLKFTKFKPEKVKENDIVFVETCAVGHFFENYHSKINCRYILITHNHDRSCPGNYKHFLDDPKIKAWFTVNPDCYHPKLIGLPLGLSNKNWQHSRNHASTILKLSRKEKSRDALLYVNFVYKTNPEVRKPVYDLFYKSLKKENWIKRSNGISFDKYLVDLQRSKFTLSPPGSGLDCHRTWEAIYMGSIPVVISSYLDELFKELPVLVVKDWHEVTKEFLEEKYLEITSKYYDMQKAYFDYWVTLINSYKFMQ